MITMPETAMDQPSTVSRDSVGGSTDFTITPTTVPIASNLNALSNTCIGSPSHISAWFILPPKRSVTNAIGLPAADRRHLSASTHTPSSTAGTDSQLIVTGTQPCL